MSTKHVRDRLLTKHAPEHSAMWRIRGEDHNADLAGPHHMPDLGLFEGKYIDIVDMAIEMPQFFTWGGGGDIKEVKSTKVGPNTARLLREAKAELRDVAKRKDDLEKHIEWLTLGGVK